MKPTKAQINRIANRIAEHMYYQVRDGAQAAYLDAFIFDCPLDDEVTLRAIVNEWADLTDPDLTD